MFEVPGSWFEVCLFVRLVQQIWVEVGGLREDLIGVTFNGGPRLVDAVGAGGRRKIELTKLDNLK